MQQSNNWSLHAKNIPQSIEIIGIKVVVINIIPSIKVVPAEIHSGDDWLLGHRRVGIYSPLSEIQNVWALELLDIVEIFTFKRIAREICPLNSGLIQIGKNLL